MLVGFSFRARPGKAADLEALLSDPDGARRMAQAMGASRNILFWQGDRMVRILEFPDDATPVPLGELAARDAGVREFLGRVSRLTEPPFDPSDPASMAAFDEQAALRVVYDVRA